jgi:response regulator RpfG family c-di-GMP phosphodiesterase
MEANEVQELQEHAEHAGHELSMRPVALTMTLLAVLVAVVTVLGHRTHTEEVLNMVKASDTWNEYQAKKIRAYNTQLMTDLLGVVTIADQNAANKIAKGYSSHQDKWAEDFETEKKQAEAFEEEVKLAEKKGNHYDLGEALLEIGLVITSITLLTKKRVYWLAGMGASVVGIVATVFGLLLK